MILFVLKDTIILFPDTIILFADTFLSLPDTIVLFPDTIILFADTFLSLPDTIISYPDTMYSSYTDSRRNGSEVMYYNHTVTKLNVAHEYIAQCSTIWSAN